MEKDRVWQEECRKCYRERHQAGQSTFLMAATMGAGKTKTALDIAVDLVKEGAINRVIVVTRSIGLKEQWVEDATKAGLALEGEWDPQWKPLTPTFIGLVITYQKLTNRQNADWLERFCADYQVLVIMDEPHHMSEGPDMTWGDVGKQAFGPAFRRLLLTATPWRSDGSRIPFVEYDDAGLVKADFTYSYVRGIVDNVCRMVFFPTLDGTAEYALDKDVFEHESLDGVNEAQLSNVCKTIFKPGAGWIMTTLECAHANLMEKRASGHPDAGGLLIVSRCDDARTLGRLLRAKWRVEVVVATSDREDEGAKQIKRFKKGNMPWLIAVGMVSEGVNIPRLRVGVYATTVRTVLMFRQIVGRFVRMIGDLEDINECATVYMPKLQPWVRYARAIEEEVQQALREEDTKVRKTADEPAQPRAFTALGSTAVESDVIGSGDFLSQEEIIHAQDIAQGMSLRADAAQLALFLRKGGVAYPRNEEQSQANGSGANASAERKGLTNQCAMLGRRYIRMTLGRTATEQDFEAFFGKTIPQRFGVKVTRAANDRLYEIRDWLVGMVAGGVR